MAKNIEINVKTNDGYETLYPENQCLKLSGGTVTGNLIVNGNTTVNGSLILPNSPINGTDASNKSYVDGRYTAGNGININDGVVSVSNDIITGLNGISGWIKLQDFQMGYGYRGNPSPELLSVPRYNCYKVIFEYLLQKDSDNNISIYDGNRESQAIYIYEQNNKYYIPGYNYNRDFPGSTNYIASPYWSYSGSQISSNYKYDEGETLGSVTQTDITVSTTAVTIPISFKSGSEYGEVFYLLGSIFGRNYQIS